MVLAILPVDTRAIRITCWVYFTLCILFGLLIFTGNVLRDPNITSIFLMTILLSAAFLMSPALCCSFCCPKRAMHPRAALRHLWRVFRLTYVGMGPAWLMDQPFGVEMYPWTWFAHPFW